MMNESPKVTVVLATYNRGRFLPETIESILRQRFRSFEIIVVDDGSEDDTRKVVGSYGSKIRYVYQENSGPSAARNLGIRYARGSWIAIQDSDDVLDPHHLEVLFGFVEKNPSCAMVFANGSYLSGREHNRETILPKRKSHRLASQGVELADLFDKSIVRLQAALISRVSFLAIGGLDESLRICMDLDLAFRLYMCYPIAYLDKVVFYYRRHEGNISRNEERRLSENIWVMEKLLREFPKAKDLLGEKRIARRMAYRHYRLAKGRWRDGSKDGAREAIQQAVSLCPLSIKYRLYRLRWN